MPSTKAEKEKKAIRRKKMANIWVTVPPPHSSITPPSPSPELSDSMRMTEIGQSIFELCERKTSQKLVHGSVGQSVRNIKLALLQALSLATAPWRCYRGVEG